MKKMNLVVVAALMMSSSAFAVTCTPFGQTTAYYVNCNTVITGQTVALPAGQAQPAALTVTGNAAVSGSLTVGGNAVLTTANQANIITQATDAANTAITTVQNNVNTQIAGQTATIADLQTQIVNNSQAHSTGINDARATADNAQATANSAIAANTATQATVDTHTTQISDLQTATTATASVATSAIASAANANTAATTAQATANTALANTATQAGQIATMQTTQSAQGQAITDLSKTVSKVSDAANQVSVTNGVATIKNATSLSFDNGTSVNGTVSGTQLSATALKVGTAAVIIESADAINAATGVKSGVDRITSDGNPTGTDHTLHIGGAAVGVDPATGKQYASAPSAVVVDNVLFSQNATSGKSEAVLTTSDLNPIKQQISNLGSQVQANRLEATRGISGVAAMASLSNPLPGQNFYVGVGVGTYAGQQSIAIGVSARINQNVVAKVGYSSAGTAGASVGFGW